LRTLQDPTQEYIPEDGKSMAERRSSPLKMQRRERHWGELVKAHQTANIVFYRLCRNEHHPI